MRNESMLVVDRWMRWLNWNVSDSRQMCFASFQIYSFSSVFPSLYDDDVEINERREKVSERVCCSTKCSVCLLACPHTIIQWTNESCLSYNVMALSSSCSHHDVICSPCPIFFSFSLSLWDPYTCSSIDNVIYAEKGVYACHHIGDGGWSYSR